jgi:hypothetical protein
MKLRTLALTFFIIAMSTASIAQNRLRTDEVTDIPVWTQYGIARNYTREELLQFIAITGWEAQYASDKRFVPYTIAKGSDQLLTQVHTEARVLCYKMNLNSDVFYQSYIMLSKLYGSLPERDFRKYCLILSILSKIDMIGKVE